jgi:hypothetical protein
MIRQLAGSMAISFLPGNIQVYVDRLYERRGKSGIAAAAEIRAISCRIV